MTEREKDGARDPDVAASQAILVVFAVPKFQIEGRVNESFWALRPVISGIHVDRGANSLTFHQTYEAQHIL